MTKHSGSLLVEVLISITIFIIGLMALIGAITYSVGSIMKSREDISGDMEITNMTERDAMRLTISPDNATSLSGTPKGNVTAKLVPPPLSGDKDDTDRIEIPLKCGLYLYEYESGKRRGTAFYLLQREKKNP